MDEKQKRILAVSRYYDSLDGMMKKYDRLGRKEAFGGGDQEEWKRWKQRAGKHLWELLGMDEMENCPLCPKLLERTELFGGIIREKVLLQTEPDVWMPVYILIPPAK